MTKQGIDVSYANGLVAWPKVKASGKDFAMIRLGRRAQSGGLGADTQFDENVKGAVTAGLDIGVYFYSSAKSVAEAKEEAEFVLTMLDKYPQTFTYPIAYDMEVNYTNFANQSKSLNTEIAKAFLSTIEADGYYAMLYTFKSFAESYINMKDLANYDVWIAQWANVCTYQGNYGMWQYSGDSSRIGACDGVNGSCDLNEAYQDYASIIKAIGLNGFSGDEKEGIVDDLEEGAANCGHCEDKTFFFESLATIERLAAEMRNRVGD